MEKKKNKDDQMEVEEQNNKNNQKGNTNNQNNQIRQKPIIKLDPKALEILQKNFEKKFPIK
jgi:hypothetical protein